MAVTMRTNPTIIVHSDEDPDNDNTRWGSIAHDNTTFVIDSGSDNITLDDSTTVAGDLTLGDNEVGTEFGAFWYNGTETVMETLRNSRGISGVLKPKKSKAFLGPEKCKTFFLGTTTISNL